MISIVTWIWDDGFRTYLPEHVNTLQKMFARHLKQPHRFICIADKTEGFSSDVEVIQTPVEAAKVGALRSPEGARFPSCYRRLWMFSDEAKALGDQVLLIDVDLVVANDVWPIVNRQEDFVGWRPYRDWGNQLRFGGGIYLLRTGTRSHVWKDFNGATSIAKARGKGYRGSDQAWISFKLAATEPYWSKDDGIYSIRDFNKDPPDVIPSDARIVQTNGGRKPWHLQHLPWVRENWR